MVNRILRYWPILVITLLVIIFAFPYWFKGLIPFPADYLVNSFPPWQYSYGLPIKNDAMPDVVTQMYPWKHLVMDFWKNKQIPLWNPYNFSGNPLLANYQSAVFHPFNFLFFVLPEIDAWSFLILLQPFLAGLFTYLFCRELKLSQAASCLSAVAFMFSGFMTTWMAYGTMAYALLWLPLVLYGIQKSFAKISGWSLTLVSLSLAASFFSGHFQISLYVLFAGLAFLFFKLFVTKKKRIFFLCLFFIVLGILMASIQILPAFELYRYSVRSRIIGPSEVMPWRYLITLLVPDFYGNPITRNDWLGNFNEWSAFAGVIPLILAVCAFFERKRKTVFLFGFLGLISLFLSHPSPILDLMIKFKFPVLSSSAAARINGLLSFSIAILAGFGLDKLREDLARRKFKASLLVVLMFVVIVLFVWGILFFRQPFPFDKVLIARRNLILPTGMVFAFGILVFGYWLLNRFFKIKKVFDKRIQLMIIFALLLLTTFDVFRFTKKWMPFDSREHVYPRLPILTFLTKTTHPDRVFGFFGMEMMNYYRIQGFGGYDPLYIQRYGELLLTATDGKIKPPSIRGVDLEKRAEHTMKLLNLMGGKYILHAQADGRHSWAFPFWEYPVQFKLIYEDDKYQVYENRFVFPRALFLDDYEVIKEDQAIIDRMLAKDVDLRGKLILEEEPDVKIEKNEKRESRAKIFNYQPNLAEIEIWTNTPGFLFLSDNYYPGWKAFVDGKETKIYRADYSFRAVPVPQGEHQLIFRYDPPSFKWGSTITLLSLGALVTTNIVWRRKK